MEVFHIKIRNLKQELEAAKKANAGLENRLKNKKNEIERLKQDLNKTAHENEIFKRVVYDSRMEVTMDNKDDERIFKEALTPGKKFSSKTKKGFNDSHIIINSSINSLDEPAKVNLGMQTDSLKKKDRFIQTEAHGYLDLQKVISEVARIPHSVTRKLSSKTAIAVNLIERGDSEQLRNMSEISESDKLNTERRKSSTSRNLPSNLRSERNAIESIIDSESETISESSQNKIDPRLFQNVSKINVSPLERVSTITTNELGRAQVAKPKVMSKATPVTAAVPHRVTRNQKLQPVKSDHQLRATTSSFNKKPTIGFKDHNKDFPIEHLNQLKTVDRYKRNLTSREKDFISTLVSDKQSPKTSTDDGQRNTMTAVYENSQLGDKSVKSKQRALSPETKQHPRQYLQQMKWEQFEKVKSPSRFTHLRPTRQIMHSRKDMREKIRRAVSRQ